MKVTNSCDRTQRLNQPSHTTQIQTGWLPIDAPNDVGAGPSVRRRSDQWLADQRLIDGRTGPFLTVVGLGSNGV